MSKVSVTKEKLDTLAEAVGAKSGESIPLTIDEMTDAVLGIELVNNQSNITVTPTVNEQIITPESSYTGLDSVTVEAISPVRTQSDLSADGPYVDVPRGWYPQHVYKQVEMGIIDTPTFTRSDGSHYVELTPKVNISQNGYVWKDTFAGSAVTIYANDLVSGTKNIVENGEYNVTNYAQAVVNVPAPTPTALTITPTTSQQDFSDGPYNPITVNAISIQPLEVTPSSETQVFNAIEKQLLSKVTTSQGEYLINLQLSNSTNPISIGDTIYVSGYLLMSGGSIKDISKTIVVSSDQTQSYYVSLNSSRKVNVTLFRVSSGTYTLYVVLEDNNGNQITNQYFYIKENPDFDNATTVGVFKGVKTYDGYLPVTVNPVPIDTSSTLTSNGVHTASSGSFWSSVTVSVPVGDFINNQDKTVTPTESTQTVSADSGYTGLGTVTVSAIPTTYVGTGITRNPTPTASGGTVTIPSGYYETSVLKSVDTATAGTISVAVNASGLVTATATSPAGYFAGGTKTATMQLSTQADATIVPSEEEQVLSTSGKYMLGDITVEAIETESATAVSNGTVYPSTGKYLSQVTVAVPSDIHNQNKEITPTESAQTVSADVGYSGLGTVTVKAISQTYVGSAIPKNQTPTVNGKTVTVPIGYYNTAQTVTIGSEYIVPTGTTTITSNGTYNVTTYASANINIPSDIHNQAKSVTPTESVQTISADSGYSGLSTVTVEAISSEYIGSGVTTRSAADLSISMNSVTAPAGYYANNATATISQYDLTAPTVVLTNSTGEIQSTAAIATGKGGYYAAQSATKTLSLTTQTGTTITPTATSQTAVAQYRWTTGTITVAAVPTDTNNSFSANGIYTPASGKWFDSVTVDVPSDINNEGAKTITPSTAIQTVTPGSGYSGLSKVTVNAIPNAVANPTLELNNYSSSGNNYVLQGVTDPSTPFYSTDGQAQIVLPKAIMGTATTAQVLEDATFTSMNGVAVVGVMPNNGALSETITTQGGTYTIPAGYTSGGTVTASLSASTITNGVLNIATITEATNDYGVEASITIPAGYYNTTTLSRILSNVLPMTTSAITESQMLSGYEAYDYQGKLLAGTMTNRGAWNATLNDTITSTTIPAGYHNGSGTVSHTTVNIPDPTFSMNNSTGVITASGAWTKGFTTDNSYSNTYSLTTQAGKTITPTESAQTAVSANRWVTGTVTVAAIPSDYVGSGITTRTSLNMSANTVTAPAGYYPNAVTATVTAMTLPTSAATTSSGTAKATITRSTATRYINIPVGYNSTAAHYVISAVANGTVVPPTTITGSQATVTAGTNVLTFSKSISVTPNVTTAGYISAGTASNVTVTLSAAVTTKAGATITPGTTNQTIAGGTYLTGTQTIAGDADLVAGNIKTGVNIFGVTGTYAGLDTSDATATAGDIVLGETAYVDGEKITGTLVVQDYYTGTTAPSNSLGQNGDIYLRGGSL